MHGYEIIKVVSKNNERKIIDMRRKNADEIMLFGY